MPIKGENSLFYKMEEKAAQGIVGIPKKVRNLGILSLIRWDLWNPGCMNMLTFCDIQCRPKSYDPPIASIYKNYQEKDKRDKINYMEVPVLINAPTFEIQTTHNQ